MMSEFVSALRAERTHLAGELSAATAALPAAIAAADTANGAYREHLEARNMRRDYAATESGSALGDAAAAANNAVASLTRSKERAQARIAEIDRLTGAAADAARARTDLATANATIADARARLAQLGEIEATLHVELDELGQKRAAALAQSGRNEIANRIAGKAAASSPRGARRNRRRPRSAHRRARGRAGGTGRNRACACGRGRRRGRYPAAAARCVDAHGGTRLFEMLPTVLPLIARLVASGANPRQCRRGQFRD